MSKINLTRNIAGRGFLGFLMVSFLGKFIVSLLISNWIYSEITLVFPTFDDVSKKVMSAISLPTHDRWPEIAEAGTADFIQDKIYDVIPMRADNPIYSPGELSMIGRYWNKLVSFDLLRPLFSSTPMSSVSRVPILSGEDIFKSSSMNFDISDRYLF